jgi:hypothetical protein
LISPAGLRRRLTAAGLPQDGVQAWCRNPTPDMKHVIEAGTDAASLILYDPGVLPTEFDTSSHDDPVGLLEQLHSEGRVYWINTGADGSYLLHAYVDEPIPPTLEPHIQDPIAVAGFQVPSGRLYFVGSEFCGSGVDAALARYPHMGGWFTIAPGIYRLTMARTVYPDALQEDLLRQEVTPGAYALHQSMGCFVWLAILCAIGFAVAVFGEIFRPWRVYLLPVLAFGMAAPFVLARFRLYRETSAKFRAIEREYPSVVARLERKGEG